MFPRQWKYFIRAWVRMSLTISHHIKYITKSWMWVVKLYTVEVENCLFMWVKIINYLNYTPQHYTPQHYTPQHYTPQHYKTVNYTPQHYKTVNHSRSNNPKLQKKNWRDFLPKIHPNTSIQRSENIDKYW